jgi:hypothetical protein
MGTPEYVVILRRWEKNGTTRQVHRLIDEQIEVNIPRSDPGKRSRGTVVSEGYGGLAVGVTFTDSNDKQMYKNLDTAKLIAANPDLFVAEHAFLKAQAEVQQ